MYFLIIGVIIFFATHLYSSFRNRERGRDIREKMGYGKYMGLYSLVTLIGLIFMVWGYGLARPSPLLFSPPTWGRLTNFAFMLPAFILLAASSSPYGYLKQILKHPMLYGILLWSAGHLLANGETNSAILFGSFFIYAVINRFAVMNRPTPVKSASIWGDIIAIVIGVVLYWLMIKYLHPMLIGQAII